MPSKLPLAGYLCVFCALLAAAPAHGWTDDNACAPRNNPDVCASRNSAEQPEAIECVQGKDDKAPVCKGDPELNKPAQENKPYVVLVSLDGFRWDYASKCGAGYLPELGTKGASAANGMIPSYPSLTFPNHYTIVTGLYPDHHGIVANRFFEPSCKPMKQYALGNPESVLDGRWYGGVPLWSLAEQQGMRSASFFWPGSEARIAGKRPAYFLRFQDATPEQARIEQIIAWLRQPPEQRPHFVTLYYSNVDHAGHEFGPDSSQSCEAVRHVDRLMHQLWIELDALAKEKKLRINLIVLSDHGMARTDDDFVALEQYVDLSQFVTTDALLYSKAGDEKTVAAAYKKLAESQAIAFRTYRSNDKELADLHYDCNPRRGDPVIVATGPVVITAQKSGGKPPKGMHGYDPRKMKDMRAIFYAVGPDIKPGVQLDSFENVDVFPLIAKILGLTFNAHDIDGKLEHLQKILVETPK